MSTPLAIRNLANAHNSTGPRTLQGKAASSRNALQHGLLCDLPIATAAENPEAWEQHRVQVCAALSPLGYLETVLAERVALLLWRQVRVARYETAIIDHGLEDLEDSVQGRRFTLPDDRPSTAADLRAGREELAQVAELLTIISDPDPACTFATAEALQVFSAYLGCLACSGLPPTVLPGRGKNENLAHYCTRRPWTVPVLQEALAAIAQAAGTDLESLQQQVEEDIQRQQLTLCNALSDQEIALQRQTHALPDSHMLDRIARYEAHISRELARTLHELEACRAQRAAEDCQTKPTLAAERDQMTGTETPEAVSAPPAGQNCQTKSATALSLLRSTRPATPHNAPLRQAPWPAAAVPPGATPGSAQVPLPLSASITLSNHGEA
jgi:hypothetical protein